MEAATPSEGRLRALLESLLRRIGELSEQGEATVAHEHQLTKVLRGKMRGLPNGALGGPRGLPSSARAPG